MNTRHEILHPLVVLGLFLFAPTFASAAVPAFPGAQGGGAVSVGGRGGQVIEVTNLNDSGAGSLRACVTATGPRTCVFRVGGEINLLTQLRVTNPFITIAGQTAPGGGITLKGPGRVLQMVIVAPTANNTIMRYFRIRKGYTGFPCNDPRLEGCGANLVVLGGNSMMDHLSTSWNQDEGLAANGPVQNVTYSYNIVSEALSTHSTGMLAGIPAMRNIDFHHNLTMSNSHRNPQLRVTSARLVNNIWYNIKTYNTRISGGATVDIIGNIYKQGPLGINRYNRYEIGVTVAEGRSAAPGNPSIYLSGNKGWNQPNPAGDQWLLATTILGAINGRDGGGPIAASWRRTSPSPNNPYPITADRVENLEANILPIVGASRRLDCNGNWVSNRDAVDTRVINQYKSNTGVSSLVVNEGTVGGYPTIPSGTACPDADHDGMPDGWETARGLNPNNAADRNAIAASGYTNLEVYLAGAGSGITPPSPPPPPPPAPPPPTTSLPDVVVTTLSYANGIFTSTVKNQGTAATPSGVAIRVGYSVDGVFRTWGGVNGPLAAGASVTIGTNGGAYIIPTGTHTYKAYVDDANRFAESNETNNQLAANTSPPPPPPPTISRADLVVTSLSYANRSFTCTVKNQGTAATPSGVAIGVGYFVDGVYRTWGGVNGPLAAGASVTIGTNGRAYTIPAGTHSIKAYVDDVNRIAESNETNNQLAR